MKNILLGAVVAVGLMVGSGAVAATVGKGFLSGEFIGKVEQTSVYRMKDADSKAVCYFAFTGTNAVEMECVK